MNNLSPPIALDLFDQESFSLLVRLKTAFSTLKQLDSNVGKIDFTSDHLDVFTTIGRFLFERNLEMTTLYFTSPVSGVFKYYYEPKESRWISNKDEHILEDNLVRETSKHFKAYLQL